MSETKKCMVCGETREITGSVCVPCQDRIRREALGQQSFTRDRAEQELKQHGVSPTPKKEKS
jgi:hypothetical protein